MRIPQAYQSQALSSLPAITQTPQENPEQSSVSLRVGKLGITYTTQNSPQTDSTTGNTGQTASRIPTTSFAQELSLALAQSTTPSTDTALPGWSNQSAFGQRTGLQAYSFQAAAMSTVSTQTINAMV